MLLCGLKAGDGGAVAAPAVQGGGGGAAAPPSSMSVDEAWDLNVEEKDVPPWLRNNDSILAEVKRKLEFHGGPMKYLENKYPTPDSKLDYARVLWQQLPPLGDKPLFLDGDVPGHSWSSMSVKVHIVHLASLSFLETSTVCPPSMERCLKLADEILTDGFVTDTEPLMLNVAKNEMSAAGTPGIPPWGEMTETGQQTLRAFSLCHHKSAARAATLHLLVNIFLEEWCLGIRDA